MGENKHTAARERLAHGEWGALAGQWGLRFMHLSAVAGRRRLPFWTFVRAGAAVGLAFQAFVRAGAAMRRYFSYVREWLAGAAFVLAGYSSGTGVCARGETAGENAEFGVRNAESGTGDERVWRLWLCRGG